jgi:hypothetical protein
VRRILVADPAISMREGTDATGISDGGLDADEQVYIFADLSKKIAWDDWGDLLVERYFINRCDCIVLERNRGGDACAGNVRTAAEKYGRAAGRDIRVEVVADDAVTRHSAHVVFVKERVGRGSKGTRAEPVAAHYKAGRVSHVIGADLQSLEDLLTTWIPEEKGESPNALDALVYCVDELAGLSREKPRKGDVLGAAKLQAMASAQRPATAPNIAAMMPGRRGGDGDGGRILMEGTSVLRVENRRPAESIRPDRSRTERACAVLDGHLPPILRPLLHETMTDQRARGLVARIQHAADVVTDETDRALRRRMGGDRRRP